MGWELLIGFGNNGDLTCIDARFGEILPQQGLPKFNHETS